MSSALALLVGADRHRALEQRQRRGVLALVDLHARGC